jgi:zinc protease
MRRLLLIAATWIPLSTVLAADLEIPFDSFTLDNGLRVIVHEDNKAPIVAVNIWYHVGSKNENPGKTGFAHLFEHLMFNGTENYDDEYFKPFQEIGATGMNGTTSFDRTNYFQVVPKTAVDLALWMESDRMGHLLGAITQETLDEQRGVVQNEKRQRDNQPYGNVFEHVLTGIFPPGHPYSWPTIGSMADLNAASLDDVQDWFKTYYGPNNAVLVIAGDIDLATARAKVTRYFGDIPPGPPLKRQQRWLPHLDSDRRLVIEGRVPQTRVYRAWVAPSYGDRDITLLTLADAALTSGKTSRLYQSLVYEQQIATDIGATAFFGEIAGVYIIYATVQPGGDPAQVEKVLDDELQAFLRRGPSRKELELGKTQERASFIRGIERVGGFGGKSAILAQETVYTGDTDHYQKRLQWLADAGAREVRDAARRWLGAASLTITVEPYAKELRAVGQGVDRDTGPPLPDSFPEAEFPTLQRAELDNGLKIIVARRPAVPVVNLTLMLDSGFAADQFGLPGTARLAMEMLDEGTSNLNALEISEQQRRLGAAIGTGTNVDTATISLSALTELLDESLELYADIIRNPLFPEAELERLKKLRLAEIKREQATPVSMALRLLPKLLYGSGHAYGLPATGSGTEASVTQLSRAHLQAFHEAWFKPNNATLIVTGDTSLEEILPRLQVLFSDWQRGATPTKNIAPVANPPRQRVFLVDRPDSEQSIILGGQLLPPQANPDELAINAMNDILGGSFVSRINMNLREDKAWSYGARTIVMDAVGPRTLLAYAPVQADKTIEALAEIRRELLAILSDRPIDSAEVAITKRKATLTLPGRWETASAVAGSIADIVRFKLADDYWDGYPQQIAALNAEWVNQVAENYLKPDSFTWVVVGDKDELEVPLRELGLGPVTLVDTEGNEIAPSNTASAN